MGCSGCNSEEGPGSSREGRAAQEFPGSLELGLAVLPALGPSNDTQLWLPEQSFSKPRMGMESPLHWCLLVSWLVLRWVEEIRLLNPQRRHGDGDRHHPGVLEQDIHPSSQQWQ